MSLTFRILLTLVLLLLLPTFASVAGARDTNFQIAVNRFPDSSQPTLSVTGVGARADRPVDIQLVTFAEGPAPATPRVRVDPDGNGEFVAALSLPAYVVDGNHALRIEQHSADGRLLQSTHLALSADVEVGTPNGAESAPPAVIWAALLALLLPGALFQGGRLAMHRV